ncbi:uncharacterized protein NPIL_226281 [Nephila pilipes]|uniref:Venom protein n=1 Tax=Nephila pilipes TaxID=299642 RepID=A0A8X6QM35_NEPPI|nr:uncharacterized protein NPIL_226281 [Nephila pilipes]
MKLLFLSIVAVLFGTITCKNRCYKEKLDKCNQELIKSVPETDTSFCGFQKKSLHCLIMPAIECKLRFKSKAEKLNSVMEIVCDKGSKLHNELYRHYPCIMNGLMEKKCLKIVSDKLKDDISPKTVLKAQKESCKTLEKRVKCQLEEIKHGCGKNVQAFFRTVFDPLTEVQRGLCEEIILPEIEDASPSKRSTDAILPDLMKFMEFLF